MSTKDDGIVSWFGRHLPDDLYAGEVTIHRDRDEILVMGEMTPGDDPEDTIADAVVAFRERTRDARVAVAERAEARFDRKVAWGVRTDEGDVMFTHLTVPVMTRLRIRERQLLDTLVGAGVARSRSDALGWCVRLVADKESDWLAELREAISAVEKVRAQGPG